MGLARIISTKYKKIVTIGILIALSTTFGTPFIGRADVDVFPLPETFVDSTSTSQPAPDGRDGVLGDTGADGTSAAPVIGDETAGKDGADSTANFVDDLPGDNVSNQNGVSTAPGQPGANGADGQKNGNQWNGRAANVYIKTGDATAFASIINYLNTTVLGSSDIDIINIYGPATGTLDFSNFNPGTVQEEESSTSATPTIIDTSNNGTLSNNLTIDASSGINRVEGVNGNVVIETGNVSANASIFNMVNTNLIGKNWKFKIINIFSDLIGDLILPTLYSEKTATGCSGCLSSLNISTDNSGSINNTIVVNADTGQNAANDAGGLAVLKTGQATADASVFNLLDSTILGDDWYYTTFRVAGDWKGKVYNANPTAEFLTSDNGATIRDEQKIAEDAAQEPFALIGKPLHATTDNTALLQNKITINGGSGNNIANDVFGDVSIKTGDVRAKSAITNIVNTTIIGDGWRFYLVNIFGKWKGSAYYGMPDLAISEIAVPEAVPARRGNKINYVYSFTNGGDTTAQDVILRDRFDADKVHVTDTSGGVVRGNMITWRVGNLRPRETRVISYTTTINAPDGSQPVQNEVTISGQNGDRDSSNNTTGGKVNIAGLPGGGGGGGGGNNDGGGGNNDGGGGNTGGGGNGGSGGGGGGGGGSTLNPEFNVVKTADHDTYRAGETVPFTIILDNFKPYSGYEVGVVDQFLSPTNDILLTEVWDLGEVIGFEHIEITYSLPIPTQAVPGPYLNRVTIFSKNARGDILPAVTTNLPVTITASPAVLGALQQAGNPLTLDAIPIAFLQDLLIGNDASFTVAPATDFAATQVKIKRGNSKTSRPLVRGDASRAQSGGQRNIQQLLLANSDLQQGYKINIGYWILLILMAGGLIIMYQIMKQRLEPTWVEQYMVRYAKTAHSVTTFMRNKQTLLAQAFPLIASTHHRVYGKFKVQVQRVSVLTRAYPPLIASMLNKLSANLKSLLPKNKTAKKDSKH